MGVRFRSIKVIRWGLAGTLAVVGGTLFWVAADRAMEKFFARFRPQLEQELSKPLGRPLLIGPYKGLRPWGVAIGQTKLLSGFRDNSTAKFSSLTVKIAPIASFLQLRPVAIVRLKGANINLRSNESGTYWAFGVQDGSPPNIDLRVQLVESSKILVGPTGLEFRATARTSFLLAQKKASGTLQLGSLGGGSLSLKGKGYWDRLELKARARLKQIELAPFHEVFSQAQEFKAEGKLDGDFQFGIEGGRFKCKGGMGLSNFFLKGGQLQDSLSSTKTTLNCSNDSLELASPQWKYGPWLASIAGAIPLNSERDFNLGVTSSLRMKDIDNSELNVKAILPVKLEKKGIIFGDLFADLKLRPFPLAPLGSLVGNEMAGTIAAKGQISGPLSSLKTSLSIGVVNPQLNGLRLQEEWQGNFVGSPAGGGSLTMASKGAAVPGAIFAQLSSDWSLDDLVIKRLGGKISIKKKAAGYSWLSEDFRLDRVEVAISPEKSFKRIFGLFSGKGSLGLSPASIQGEMIIQYPRFMGLRLREARIKGNYLDKNYSLSGKFYPPDKGNFSIDAEGFLGGALKAKANGIGLSPKWLTKSALQIQKLNTSISSTIGRANDLGTVSISVVDSYLDSYLNALLRSQIALIRNSQYEQDGTIVNPNNLSGEVDVLISLEGPDLTNLVLDLEITGKLWPNGKEEELDLQIKPFVARVNGPLQGGVGEFSLVSVPFSLISLLRPLPSALNGRFGLSGRYNLGDGSPEISAELTVEDARLSDQPFVLEKGKFFLAESILKTDVVLRSKASVEPVKLIGQIPLTTSLPIDLRIESHGDGIAFLDGLTAQTLFWKSGTADFRMLITGTLDNPKANGFLVVKKGKFILMNKNVNDLYASMVFDFNRLEVNQLQATIGSKGIVKGKGNISLFRPELVESRPLNIEMSNVPFKLPVADVQIASSLTFKGALIKPLIGGELTLKEGSISPKRSGSGKVRTFSSTTTANSTSYFKRPTLPEQKWDLKTPLVLFVQDEEAPASKLLRESIPKDLSAISFDSLRLRLGPNLRITSQPLANFNVAGLLTLNGALDETLSARGVVRLEGGRINFFTTTFTLDRREPNVAVFTPSMGLIPYLDVTMKSRVPDTVKDASNLASSSDFATNGSTGMGIGGSRFVKVEIKATGPADRISENFELRSVPPMPRSQLLGLIGGNSLTRLLSGGESDVLVSVLSRSLISPVLGNITGSFSEKLQLSLYPAYVAAPDVLDKNTDNESADSDGQLSPQQAWVTEVGIDLNKRFNFSLQATPNRKDIPPQGTLTFQVNPNLGILGSLDNAGIWQSQFQLFLRF